MRHRRDRAAKRGAPGHFVHRQAAQSIARGQVHRARQLPAEQQMLIVYGAAVLNENASAEPAQAFIKFLADPANRKHWKEAGFDPPAGS
jgi:ABC-type molybdate transport system substrate-binding protein